MSDEDDLPSVGEVALLVSQVREGKPDPEGLRRLLGLFCATARGEGLATLSPHLIDWLVQGFERHLAGEPLESALGLKRPRGRPTQGHDSRNAHIAADVYRLHAQGIPLNDNAEQSGVFYLVADKWEMSGAQVRDIYYDPEHSEMGKAIVMVEKLGIGD